ncbi:MAG: hypothetical protein OJF49_004275 [Ktedonobacterales bacterium]|nr:MAG: hypothetical protein OJF49_004275 [Ktedonobacterales bacterium]
MRRAFIADVDARTSARQPKPFYSRTLLDEERFVSRPAHTRRVRSRSRLPAAGIPFSRAPYQR